MKDRITPLRLGLALIRLHLLGWRGVPGYTCTDRESSGDIYIAMQLRRQP
jgi:hypothetical protein